MRWISKSFYSANRFLACFIFLISPLLFAQNQPQLVKQSLNQINTMAADPVEITGAKEQVTNNNFGRDDSLEIYVTVKQHYFLGGNVSFRFYWNGQEIEDSPVDLGVLFYNQTRTVRFWYKGPPGKTNYVRVVRTASSVGQSDEYTMLDTASTEPLKVPYVVDAQVWSDSVRWDPVFKEFIVYNPSDKFVNVRWKKGTNQPSEKISYRIYKNGQYDHSQDFVGNFTGNTTPDTEDEWSVQTVYMANYSSQQVSPLVGSKARTAPLKSPRNFTASKDTTNDYIHLKWERGSHWANQINIYRDGVMVDSVDAFEKEEYLDYTAIPGVEYEYYLTSYAENELFTRESEPTDVQQGRTAFIKATDGQFVEGKNAVELTWSWIHRDSTDIIRVARDDTEFQVSPGQKRLLDEGGQPGKLYKYSMYIRLKNGHEIRAMDYGFRLADGRLDGLIQTRSGGPVKDIDVRAKVTPTPLSSSMSFDGNSAYVKLPYIPREEQMTVSAWIKTSATAFQRIMGWSNTAPLGFKYANNVIFFSTTDAGKLQYGVWDGFPYHGEPKYAISSTSVNTGEWVFVSAVYNNGTVQLYVNGVPDGRSRNVGQQVVTNTLSIGADLSDITSTEPDDLFNGLIDEVSIWNVARTTEQIKLDMHHLLRGTEDGLVGYWPFNLGEGTVAGDFAREGNHHGELKGDASWDTDLPEVGHYGVTNAGGRYSIENIFWAYGADIIVQPFKEKHGFNPGEQSLRFNPQKHFWEEVDFKDTTSISVSGQVDFSSVPPCGMEGVEILLNNKSTGVFTDSSGHFDILVEEPGNYKIAPEFKDHTFAPPDTIFRIEDTVTSLLFTDTTTANFNGKVRAGCDIILGTGKILIKGLHSDCFSTTVLTNAEGEYQITLPAQEYTAQLIDIDHPDRVAIINYFKPDTIDLTEQDSTHNFIYHAPPAIVVSGFPPRGCGDFEVPIAEQEVTYPLKIELFETYENNTNCPVTTGIITIKDRVGHNVADTTISLGDTAIVYLMFPGYPNLTGGGAHPNQKMFIVDAKVGHREVSDTTWVFVQGHKQRDVQFSTVSPEVPLMILRDPPGDQSFSYISKATTSNILLGLSLETDAGIGVFSEAKVGGGFDLPVIGKGGAWVGTKAEATLGVRSVIEGTYEMEITTTETLKTSDSEKVTGASGDLFMGAAFNIMYAKTDVLEYDFDNCSIIRDTNIVWFGNGFKTTYLYTNSHIRESVIPNLLASAAILQNSPQKVDRDRAEVLVDQAGVWQQVLDYNDRLKNTAQPLPPLNGQPQFPGNISFSAGGNLVEEATMTTTIGASFAFYLYVSAEFQGFFGAKQDDWNEYQAGFKIFSKLEVGAKTALSYKTTNTIGFELSDDDVDGRGDAFTVDVLGDAVYGTPVFKLVGGSSSCPWEGEPTSRRESVGLSMDTYIQKDVPNSYAQFDLYLTNASQSEEARTYYLSTIHTSNPDGAKILVNQVQPENMPFPLPYNVTNPERATLRVEREPGTAYDYENLQVHLFSPCDDQIDTTVTFSVHFAKPCTDVTIASPENNWVVNSLKSDTLEIVLSDYDKDYPTLDSIKFEYRTKGSEDWIELFNRPRATVLHDTIFYIWDVSALDDEVYELRASSHCPTGSYYSRRANGVIDRVAPEIFGTKQPGDQILESGDEISATFDEILDRKSVTLQNIFLLDSQDSSQVNIEVKTFENKITISPTSSAVIEDNKIYRALITGISDLWGNTIPQPISWEFVAKTGTETKVEELVELLPTQFALEQNYPNPFNPTTNIRYALPESRHVVLAVYNMLGQEVKRLVDIHQNAGYYTVKFDGNQLGSGLFFYRIQAGDFVQIRKMLLVR